VNVLVALSVAQHEFHDRVATWIRRISSKRKPEFATCAIAELGFIRILAQVPQYSSSVTHASSLLLRLKNRNRIDFTFIADDHDTSQLPSWVKTAKQTTDGHLAELARAHGAILATLDERVPGAFVIP
jgi:predicted nucleic acid-binding protein